MFEDKDKHGDCNSKWWGVTVGANASARMDNIELKKCVETDVFCLCLDAADVPGQRVMLKTDGGPGRLHMQTLAKLGKSGFHLCPTVLNSTAVLQETDVDHGQSKSSC